MKIMYIVGPTMMSGALISFKIILEGMIAKGCEIVVLVSNRNQNDEFIKQLIEAGCTVEGFTAESYVYPKYTIVGWQHSFVKFPWRLARKLFNIVSSNRQVLRLIRQYEPTLVHTNVGVLRQGYYACKRLNIPHIWHLREYQTKDFGWSIMPTKGYFKKLLRSTNVLTITKDIFDYFDLQKNGSSQALWDAVLPHSEVCYKSSKQRYFLCANRISPEKNVEDVVIAFSAVVSELPSDCKLIIVGEQHNKPYCDKITQIIESTSCPERIEIRPHQSNVTELMANAMALIVASRSEGLGRMTLEAIFKGCLVLGRATGGTKEILEETKGGFLYNTVDELGQLILRIAKIEDTDEYKSMIEYAQKIVVERTSNDNYNDKVYEFYKYAIGRKTVF